MPRNFALTIAILSPNPSNSIFRVLWEINARHKFPEILENGIVASSASTICLRIYWAREWEEDIFAWRPNISSENSRVPSKHTLPLFPYHSSSPVFLHHHNTPPPHSTHYPFLIAFHHPPLYPLGYAST